MPRIFISYRRDDSAAITGRIYDRLVRAFGSKNIFRDIDAIPAGSDFRQVIGNAMASCDVMLVIIGPIWSNIQDENGQRRLDNQNDFVRIEVETSLRLSQQVRVIPVLVNAADMPEEMDLPVTLRELPYRHAVEVRNDPDFGRDIERLIRQIRQPNFRGRTRRILDKEWINVTTGILSLLVAAFACFAAFWAVIPEDKRWPFAEKQELSSTPTHTSTDTPSLTDFPTVTLIVTKTETPTSTPTPTIEPSLTLTTTQTSTSTGTYTPTSTATTPYTASFTPTLDTQPSSTVIVTILAATPTATLRSYPCDAQIVSRTPSSTQLSVIRSYPSNRAPLREPIQQDTNVKILEKSEENPAEVWYRIANDASSLGWISSEYIVPSGLCPE